MGNLQRLHVYQQLRCRYNQQTSFLFPLFFLVFSGSLFYNDINAQCTIVPGTISGQVVWDKNYNGIKDASDQALSNIKVIAVAPSGNTLAEAYTANDGSYKLTGLKDGDNYLIEISKPGWLEYSLSGADYISDIRIQTAPACNILFGLFDPSYNGGGLLSDLAVSCFVQGESNSQASGETLVRLSQSFKTTTPISKIAMHSQTGAVWGLAYKKSSNQLFSSAFVKVGTGLGALGTGGIYQTNYQSMVTTPYIDLKTLGINTGSVQGVALNSCAYGNLVGKVGLGDMDISSDENLLFVSNLYQKSIVILPTLGANASNTFEIKVPDPGCSNSDYAVSALKYNKGSLYVGVTCTAETSANEAEHFFHVYEMNLLTRTFHLIFSTDFGKKYWPKDVGTAAKGLISQWLTDIDFSDGGDMILAIADRNGHSFCRANEILTNQFGDILMLHKDNGLWSLERNGVVGTLVGSGSSNGQGPGGGEFFGEDYWVIGPSLHPEVSMGSIAVVPGSDQVISSAFDPVYESLAGGLHRYSTINGKKLGAVQLYNSTSSAFGKASGLGDVEVVYAPAEIVIGNRIWLDSDGDGLQDPNESGISGLRIALYDSQCNLLTTTVTDINGNYLFNKNNVAGGILYNSQYYIVLQDSRFDVNNQKLVWGNDSLCLTIQDATLLGDNIDSDAFLGDVSLCPSLKGIPMISAHTGNSGQNNYTLDFGFKTCGRKEEGPVEPNPIYDIALIKQVNPISVIAPQGIVVFDITVVNQGDTELDQFEISDYIPDGLEFIAEKSAGWKLVGRTAVYNSTSALIKGEKRVIPIGFKILYSTGIQTIINTAEVSALKNAKGEDIIDIDSKPDNDPNNDAGGIVHDVTDNQLDGDGFLDEDDHDRESLVVYDLALIKRLEVSSGYKVGDFVQFDIYIQNQGNQNVASYEITDYLGEAYEFDHSLNPEWNIVNGKLVYTSTKGLAPYEDIFIPLKLKLTKYDNTVSLINTAEISSMRNEKGEAIMDVDSRPDQDPDNDAGAGVFTENDDRLDGDGLTDEDDHDQAGIFYYDLALILQTNVKTPVKLDQLVPFQIQLINQGNIAVSCFEIVDYIPVGLEFVAASNPSWKLENGIAKCLVNNELLPGGSVTKEIVLKVVSSNADELINFAEISSIQNSNKDEVSDVDSKQDADNSNDLGGIPSSATDNLWTGNGVTDDEDDHDPEALQVFDLALILTADNALPVKQNEDVIQHIKICNQGSVSAQNIQIVDYLPSGLILSSHDNNGWMFQGGILRNIVQSELKPGECTTIDIVLRISDVSDPSALLNRAEIVGAEDLQNRNMNSFDIDSDPDMISTNDNGGLYGTPTDNLLTGSKSFDEDDADPELVHFVDLALRKTVAAGTYVKYLGELKFIIEVFNQSNTDVKNVLVSDYLPSGYELAATSISEGWTSQARIAQIRLSELKAYSSTLLEIKIQATSTAPENNVFNYSEISAFQNASGQDIGSRDFDSTPDAILGNDLGAVWNTETDNMISDHGMIDEDDEDIAGIGIYDLALRKTVPDIERFYNSKDTVDFAIEVFNQGSLPVSGFDVIDYVDTNYIFDASLNPGWTLQSSGAAIYTDRNTLKVGSKKVLHIHLIIRPKRQGLRFCNVTELSAIYRSEGVVIEDFDSVADSDPTNDKTDDVGYSDKNNITDNGNIDEDDQDQTCTNPDNFDLALAKDVGVRIVEHGQDISFKITVVNQGTVPATSITVVDYLPEGLRFRDPDWVAGPMSSGKFYYTFSVANGKIPAGGLKYRDTLAVYFDVEVTASARKGAIVNRAEIFAAENDLNLPDEDSKPDDIENNDSGGNVFTNQDKVGNAIVDEGDITGDEDDADPAGVFLVEVQQDLCRCLNNATTPSNGQFISCFNIESQAGDVWFIREISGLYSEASAAPPAAPTEFTTGPLGFVVPSVVSNGTSEVFEFCAISIDGHPFSFILENQYGDKVNYNSRACGYDVPHQTTGYSPVCSNSDVHYGVAYNPSSTYEWTLSSGGTITSDPNLNEINVHWTGGIGTSHLLTIREVNPNSCLKPLEIPVTVQTSTAEQMNCIGDLQVSLDKNCQAIITPNILLAGGPYTYTNYAVIVMDKHGYIIPNATVDGSYIGQVLTAKVMNICNGNSCWSKLTIEDKTRPQIVCANDTILCTRMTSYLKPYVYDNCDPNPTKELLDETIENTSCDPNYSKIVTRVYSAIDKSGNRSSRCTTKIYLKRIPLDSIVYPDSFSLITKNPLTCNNFEADSLGHPLPEETGVPTLNRQSLYPNNDQKYCDYSIRYYDLEIPDPKSCNKKILRNWEIFTWTCSSFDKRVFNQLIEIVDRQAPTILALDTIRTTTTPGYNCEVELWIPPIKTFDSCGSEVRVDLVYPGGIITDFKGAYLKIPADTNVLKVRAYDKCHNVDSASFVVIVQDLTPPVAVCDKEMVVSLDRFGEAWVPAHVFDDGSYDECHIKSMKVRRMDNGVPCTFNSTVFADSVGFCCQDVGKLITVIMLVTDHHGNANSCMVQVEVQDKVIPTVYPPHDVTISCERHINLNDLSEFGSATVSDNCVADLTEVDSIHIDQCREGYIDRIFVAGNALGYTVAVQRITIINEHPFTEKDIIWPYDFDTTTCQTNALDPTNLPDTLGYPILIEDFCDLTGVSYEDHLFRFVNGSDACYKILRKWKVINWCRFGSNENLYYEHTQIIKVNNTIKPTIQDGCEDLKVFTPDTSCFGAYVDIFASADDDCTPADQLFWQYSADLNSDGIVDSLVRGVGGVIRLRHFYPLGSHEYTVLFEDLCGNQSACTRAIEVINKKKPVAYCKYGLAASLVPMDLNNDGKVDQEMVTIWAKDFDQGSYHPCNYPITYSFGLDTTVKSITYNCDSIGRREVTLCITASNGEQDCCQSFIDIQSNTQFNKCSCVRFPADIIVNSCVTNYDPSTITSIPILGTCPCTHLGTSHSDSIVTNVPNYCYVIYRKWTVRFNCPNEGLWVNESVQKIYVTTNLKDSDITWPSDSVLVDNCTGAFDTAIIHNTPKFCDYNGQVMLRFTDREIGRNTECVFIERLWTVFSKCVASQSFSFRQVLKIVNFSGVKYFVPADITVTDCKKVLVPDSLNGYPYTNCNCDIFNHSYRDSTVNGGANACYTIYRKWTSTFNCPPDVVGTFMGTQKITVVIDIQPGDIDWPADSVYVDNCGGKVDTGIIDNVPKLFKDFCGYVSISYSDQVLSNNDTCKIIRRTWLVSNTCRTGANKQEYRYDQILKVIHPNGPKLILPPNITVTDCKKPLLPDSLNGYPTVDCACDSLMITYRDDTIRTNPEICYQVNRNWSVRVRCRPIVDTVLRGTQIIIRDVNLNPADIIWPQDSFTSYSCIPNLDPSITGMPSLSKDYCGLIHFSYVDSLKGGGECRTIQRTWTARNDCSASQVFRFNQYLITKNQGQPSITCTPDTVVNANQTECGAIVNLPDPTLNNSCNAGVQFTKIPTGNFYPVGMTTVLFIATDSCGNKDSCTTKVTVIENVPPQITCPHDTLVPCSVNTNDLSQFGQPQFSDNCPNPTLKDSVIRNQNICGIGTITRIFTVTDASGNTASCSQIITVENPNPLDSLDINWPTSPVTVEECDDIDPSILGMPTIDTAGATCFRARITYADSNLCKITQTCEIQRTWTVFDSCTNEAIEYIQTIIRNDTLPPSIMGVRDTTLYASDTSCNNYVFMKAFSGDCDSNLVVITNNSPYGANMFEDASGFYPFGTTTVTFTATDACCNQATKTILITVLDTIKPEFTCRKVVRKITDTECATFNARDFVRNATDNCSDSATIMVSFDINDFMDTTFMICCDSIMFGEYTGERTVYFKDEAGNIDSCVTLFQAVDEDSICNNTFNFAHVRGLIESRRKLSMSEIPVQLISNNTLSAETNGNGRYSFMNMPLGGSYQVKPLYDFNHLDGVTTFDIVQIQKHILGIKEFDDPLKYVAADVNNNKRVTGSDISEIRKLILGIQSSFTNNTSWRFITKSYSFQDPYNPLAENFEEAFEIQKLNRNYYADFVGIKIGDIDDSNHQFGLASTTTRSKNIESISMMDAELQKAESYVIEVPFASIRNWDGVQIALQFDRAVCNIEELVFDNSNLIKPENVNLLDNGVVVLSWADVSHRWTKEDNASLKVKIKLQSNAKLSNILSILNNGFLSECYTVSGESKSLQLEFNSDAFSDDLRLYQNIPNPFQHATVVPFFINYNAHITCTVTDMNGKTVYVESGNYDKGYHEINIQKKQLPSSGIYYYHLQTDKNRVFRRMILID